MYGSSPWRALIETERFGYHRMRRARLSLVLLIRSGRFLRGHLHFLRPLLPIETLHFQLKLDALRYDYDKVDQFPLEL